MKQLKFEANNSGMRVSENGSLKTKNAHAKNFKFLRIYLGKLTRFLLLLQKEKKKKESVLLLLFL